MERERYGWRESEREGEREGWRERSMCITHIQSSGSRDVVVGDPLAISSIRNTRVIAFIDGTKEIEKVAFSMSPGIGWTRADSENPKRN